MRDNSVVSLFDPGGLVLQEFHPHGMLSNRQPTETGEKRGVNEKFFA